MWEGELLYNTDDNDESTNLAWLVDSNEDCEDENDEDANGWFVVERVVEGGSGVVFVFVLTFWLKKLEIRKEWTVNNSPPGRPDSFGPSLTF